jgi:FkbM family methyltransferase
MPQFVPASGWTVVDVGANIGMYAVWAASHMGTGRLVAIEPNPIAVRLLERTLGAIPITTMVVPVACGAKADAAVLYFRPGYTVSGGFTPRDATDQRIAVEVRPLRSILGELGVARVDLLKIDVEGAEVDVLHGAPLEYIERVVLETSDSDAVRDLMANRGFDLAHRVTDHWAQPGLEMLAFIKRLGQT